MRRFEVSFENVLPTVPEIEAAVGRVGLVVSMKGTLAKFPGCTHWHLKRGTEHGVLEVTIWPAQNRLWLSVQERRKGPWIDGAVKKLLTELAAR